MVFQNNFEMGPNDLPHEIKFPVGKNTLIARRYDPHGFWRFSFERGVLPKMLSGDFSGEAKVYQAVKAYMATREEKETVGN